VTATIAIPASKIASSPRPSPDDRWEATGLSRDEITQRAYRLPVGGRAPGRPALRRMGTDRLLRWLELWPGDSWQQRWLASGSEDLGGAWAEPLIRFIVASTSPAISLKSARRSAQLGMNALLCLGVVRPGYAWLCRARLHDTNEHIRQLSDPTLFDAMAELCTRAGHRPRQAVDAFTHLSRVIMHTGRSPRQITPADLTDYHRVLLGTRKQSNSFELAWDLLRQTGVFPDGTPSFRQTRYGGQRSITELVDAHELSCQPVRDVLVRYLTERSAGMDYSSVLNLVGRLVGRFWKDLEIHHPGIDSLRLPPETAEAWKQRASFKREARAAGQPRRDRYQLLFAVRTFYLDIAQWAVEDASWVGWVAPNPVRAEDVRGVQKYKRGRTALMHQRTRTLAPLLPRLVDSVEARLRHMERLAAAAQVTPVGAEFDLDGENYQRVAADSDRGRGLTGAGHLRVLRLSDGQRLNLTRDEDEAFWTWAIVETLRHTGVRVEELLELTHLALATHTLPDTGEVVRARPKLWCEGVTRAVTRSCVCGGQASPDGVRVHVGVQPLDQVVRDHCVRLDGGHDDRRIEDLLQQAELNEIRRVAGVGVGIEAEVGDGAEQGAVRVPAGPDGVALAARFRGEGVQTHQWSPSGEWVEPAR
jgi:hypothetical protein